MIMRPLNDRVVVRPLSPEETTQSGLLIPDAAKERPQEAVVLAVGPGKVSEVTGLRVQLDVKEGDRVLYSKYAGAEFQQDGEDVLLIEETDILAVLVDAPAA